MYVQDWPRVRKGWQVPLDAPAGMSQIRLGRHCPKGDVHGVPMLPESTQTLLGPHSKPSLHIRALSQGAEREASAPQ